MSSQDSGYAPLPDAFKAGLTAIVVCCFLSLISSFFLLCFLAYQALQARFSRNRGRSAIRIRNSKPQGYFWLVQLFIADFIESFTTFFIVRYLTTDSLVTGPYCAFQAVGLISGVIGSAIWTFVVAVNTFLLLACGRRTRAWVMEKGNSGWGRWVVCVVVWIFVILCGLFGFLEPSTPEKGPYYDQLGTGWCYIGVNYRWQSIFFTYGFLFLDMATLTILYGVLFFFLKAQTKRLLKAGDTENRTEDPTTTTNSQWEIEFGPEDDPGAPQVRSSGPVIVTKSVSVYTEPRAVQPRPITRRTYDQINKVSTTLLLYPVLYVVITLPISIARISEFRGVELGLPFTYVGAALFECTGLFNVLLYTGTRKGLVSWNRLKFWNAKPSNERSEGWTGNTPGAEMVTFGSGRRPSKTSTSSIAALKEETSRDAGLKTMEVDSDEESH